MAFQYYTIDAIRNIDIDDIPDSFVTYYNGLSEAMKAEVRETRPDLVSAVESATGVSGMKHRSEERRCRERV